MIYKNCTYWIQKALFAVLILIKFMQQLPQIQPTLQLPPIETMLCWNLGTLTCMTMPSVFLRIKKKQELYDFCVQVCIFYCSLYLIITKYLGEETISILKYPLAFSNAHIFNCLLECVYKKKIDIKCKYLVICTSSIFSILNTLTPFFEPDDTKAQMSHKDYQNTLFAVIISFFVGEILGFCSFTVERFLDTFLSKILKTMIQNLFDL